MISFINTLLLLGMLPAAIICFAPSCKTCHVRRSQISLGVQESQNCAKEEPLSIQKPAFSRSTFLASMAGLVLTATSKQPASAATAASTVSSGTSALQESFSGSIAGVALSLTKIVVKYPLDTATVRLQQPNSTYTIWDLPTLFESSYRGIQIPLISNIPAGAVFFAVKDACKELVKPYKFPRWMETTLAVGAAQIPYWLVRNPSEVVKTRQQAGVPGYGEGTPALKAFQNVARDAQNSSTGLIEAYYLGYWENILYAYPADLVKFVVYEQLTGGRRNLPPAEGAIAGAVSTGIAQVITTPLDVLRNRLMMEQDQQRSKLNYLESIVELARQEGFSGLFAGLTPRVGKAIVSGAIQFATYEETKMEVAKLFQRQSSQ